VRGVLPGNKRNKYDKQPVKRSRAEDHSSDEGGHLPMTHRRGLRRLFAAPARAKIRHIDAALDIREYTRPFGKTGAVHGRGGGAAANSPRHMLSLSGAPCGEPVAGIAAGLATAEDAAELARGEPRHRS
jgi:hypothetical protein